LRKAIGAATMQAGRSAPCLELVVSGMMARNLLELTCALGLFAPLLVIPGFVFGWASNVADFRHRTPGVRLLLANVFSVSLCPVGTYLVGRFTSFTLVWLCYAALGVTFLGLFLACKAVRESLLAVLARSRRVWLVVAAVWIVVGTVALSDIRTPTGLYRSLSSFDYVKHTSVVDAITRTGLPPVNPSFHPGRDQPLCYYYFWHLMGSLVDRLGGRFVSPRAAAQGGTLWAGLSLFAILLLYLKLMRPAPQCVGRRAELIAVGLLLVTGLDLLPVMFFNLLSVVVPGQFRPLLQMEWWNDQITAWTSTLLWVPQHVASLVACLGALLVLRLALESRSRLAPSIAFSAVALASALGMSIWVTGVVGVAWAIWIAVCLWERHTREALVYAIVGLVFLAVCLPFVLDLGAANQSHQSPVVLGVRHFGPLEVVLNRLHVTSEWSRSLWRLLLLPLNYLFELGFFLIASLMFWRGRMRQGAPLTPGEKSLLVLALASILVCTFLRASVLYNDLGFRGFLPAQFALLLWSVPVAQSALRPRPGHWLPSLSPSPSGQRVYTMVLLLSFYIGLCGTGYDMTMQRIIAGGPNGKAGLELAQAYEWVRDHTSAEQIVQHNPPLELEYYSGLYGQRQMVIADEPHGTLFGVDLQLFRRVQEDLQPVFQSTGTREGALSVCREYDISVLVFRPDDPIWENKKSWIWETRAAFQNAGARVYLVQDVARGD
jgi:hypothetical protein